MQKEEHKELIKTYESYFSKRYGYQFNTYELENYRKWFTAQWKIIQRELKRYKTEPQINDLNSRILELGSGIGGFYQFVNGSKYVGIEMDAKATEFAQKLFPNAKFLNTSFEQFATKDKFDFVTAFEVLEHVETPHLTVKKIADVLDDTGVFIGTSPFPFGRNVICDATHQYVLHPLNWKRLFLSNGFNQVSTLPLTFIPYLWRINPLFNIRIPFYINIPLMVSTTLILAVK